MTTLEQIIQKLRTTRESKGLTLDQISDRTKIPFHQLEGLEEGRFDDLPEPVYVSGFIKLYANQLGLNGQLLAGEYRQWAESENPRTQMDGNKKRIKSAPDVPIIVTDDYYQKNKIETSPPTFKTIYFNIIMIVLVLGLVSYLGMTQFNNYNNQLESGYSAATQTTNPQAINSKDSVTGAPGGSQTGSTVSNTVTGGAGDNTPHNQLVLSANRHVWIEVKSAATGDNLYIGYLEPGSNKVFDTPEQGLRIRATDGADVSISYQGKVSALGIAGQETEKVFAAAAGLPASSPSASSSSTPSASTLASSPAAGSAGSTTASSATGATAPGGSGAKPSSTNTAASTTPITPPVHKRRPVETGLHSSSSTAPASDGQSYKYGEGRLDTE